MRGFARVLGALAFIFLTYTATNRVSDPPPSPVIDVATGDAAAQIVFLNVGQGDGALIWSPEGRVALIDGGRADVADRLRQLGVDTVDIVIASHAHSDHIEGIDEVLSQLPVRFYLDNGLAHDTDDYRRVMAALDTAQVVYLEPITRTLQLGSVSLHILPPLGEGDEQNNNSVGVIVQYGDFKALFTGDSEYEALAHFARLGVPDVTLLKAAHHGARNGLTPGWLSATKPEIVVISSGRRNPYGHPDEYALRYYDAIADEVYRTDRQGGISVSAFSDGSYFVTTERDLNLPRRR